MASDGAAAALAGERSRGTAGWRTVRVKAVTFSLL